MLADLLGAYCLCHCGTKQAKREPPGVPNLHRETFIVLFACLPTVAFARAAARRDIEEYFALEKHPPAPRAAACAIAANSTSRGSRETFFVETPRSPSATTDDTKATAAVARNRYWGRGAARPQR